MRQIMLLCATAAILVTQGAAQPAASRPWDISSVSRSDSHRHAKPETGDTAGPLKYLHLEVKFDPANSQRKLHNFRVVDSEGKTVGEIFGADPKKSQLVFERDTPWASLEGLYLEGQGQRIPLFAPRPVPATVAQPAPVPAVADPTPVYVPPSESVIRLPVTRTDVPPPESVVVPDPVNPVIIHRDSVVHEGSPAVVQENVVTHHIDGYTAGGGGGHGHGGGAGGSGTGSGGCPYGDACPICGSGAKNPLEGLDPWAFDEMGRGRYDELLARIESSASARGLGSPGLGNGPAAGTGGGAGSGTGGASGAGSRRGVGPAAASAAGSGVASDLTTGLGGGPLPGMAPPGSSTVPAAGLPGMAPASGSGVGPGAAGQGLGSGSGQGTGSGQAAGSGQGPEAGSGRGQGAGSGTGSGQGQETGSGEGPASGQGQGPGPEERFAAPGAGGPGQGSGAGSGTGAMAGPAEQAPMEPNAAQMPPSENPMSMNNPMAPGGGGAGGGGGGSAGPAPVIGPRYVNLAGGPRFRVHEFGPNIHLPERAGPVIDVYRPVVPYFDPRFRFDPRISQLAYGYGRGYGGGGGGGSGHGGYAPGTDLASTVLPEMPELPKMMQEIVLYISAGNEGEEGGKIYQVNDAGRVLGVVSLPYQATGLALHRDNGLIAVTPRDRGKIYRVDDTGMLSVIMENNPKLPHPVDVGVAGESDSIIVADSLADILAATSITASDPLVYERFELARYDDQQMSVAVTGDKYVVFGTDAQRGIYRFFHGEDAHESPVSGPVLPGSGGVAADPKSLKWAATQSPNLIHVYEGPMPLHTFTLSSGRGLYGQGLLAFAPSGAVVVASRRSDEVDKEVWLTAYETAEGRVGQVLSLFPWQRERMLDFVVGPRMIWDRHSPSPYESKY